MSKSNRRISIAELVRELPIKVSEYHGGYKMGFGQVGIVFDPQLRLVAVGISRSSTEILVANAGESEPKTIRLEQR